MSRNMEKHSKRAEGQKHTIQHANKHAGSIITDKQKKKIEREI
jgi:hypothetical protein